MPTDQDREYERVADGTAEAGTPTPLETDPVIIDTVIVGAGPAGLAVAACLTRAGLPFVLLERPDCVGASWHRHYQRLHLHTHKRFSALPYLPWPREAPAYPSRREVIAYLEAYAAHFGLEPRLEETVLEASPNQGGWEVRTDRGRYHARNLVVASGLNDVPYWPDWPGRDSYRGELLHAADYQRGAPYRGADVLVVGFGNSGGEIAIDLFEHGARPALAVRSPVNIIPRSVLGLPVEEVGRLLERLPPALADGIGRTVRALRYGDLTRFGLRFAGVGPTSQVRRQARIPLIDIGTVALIRRRQIRVFPGLARFTADGVVFEDGRAASFDAVVLATGYRPGYARFLRAEVAPDAAAKVVSGVPGLYFCGFMVTAGGTLRKIGREAQQIATAIAR